MEIVTQVIAGAALLVVGGVGKVIHGVVTKGYDSLSKGQEKITESCSAINVSLAKIEGKIELGAQWEKNHEHVDNERHEAMTSGQNKIWNAIERVRSDADKREE